MKKYNNEESLQTLSTAGKITIVTALAGVMVFMFAFLFDLGTHELSKVSAQTATTTLTVLNTPPSFVLGAFEVTESSTSTPTNSDDNIVWSAIASDSNGSPYFLLLCDTNATPTALAAATKNDLGTAPPRCSSTSTNQWGVSAATPSNTLATVSTTTTEASPFDEVNTWFAWVCDDDPFNPRCNDIPVQGLSATNSSPFHVNSRPVFTGLTNNGPVNPGGALTFNSTSSDPDTTGGADTVFLVVCSDAADYSTTTNTCPTGFIASSSPSVATDATALFNLDAIFQDQTYPAFGFIVDEHGHEALANSRQANFIVNNVAPQVLGGDINISGSSTLAGQDITLTVAGGETTGFVLDFTVTDANSCDAVGGGVGDEITGYELSVLRTDLGTSTCNAGSAFNPNNCYPSGVAPTNWNLTCTASTTTCSGPTDDSMVFECTFPLWFVADPTDSNPGSTPTVLANTTWSAAVAGVDNNAATGTIAITDTPVDLISFLSFSLLTSAIPYGSLEPGDDSGTLNATTTIIADGNTGIDQSLQGSDMCGTYSVLTPCTTSASSTIPAAEQQFATTSIAYDSPLALDLSSSTPIELEINVAKSISTTTPRSGITYWGIGVPGSIEVAGSYTGLNTFFGLVAEDSDWLY